MFKFSSGLKAGEGYCYLLQCQCDLLQQVSISWQFATTYWIVTFLFILEELQGLWHTVQPLSTVRQKMMHVDFHSSSLSAVVYRTGFMGTSRWAGCCILPVE